MSPTKSSDRAIIRVKDLTEQAETSKFVLLPGGLDRVIIACEFYEVLDEIITVYGPNGKVDGPLFSAPVASGFVLLARAICDVETIETGLRRMADDERDAERLHEELYGKGGHKSESGLAKVIPLHRRHLQDPDFDPTAAPGEPPHPGQYL